MDCFPRAAVCFLTTAVYRTGQAELLEISSVLVGGCIDQCSILDAGCVLHFRAANTISRHERFHDGSISSGNVLGSCMDWCTRNRTFRHSFQYYGYAKMGVLIIFGLMGIVYGIKNGFANDFH